MDNYNSHLTKLIAILIIISILLTSCEELDTPIVEDNPIWWIRLDDAISDTSSQYGYSPQSLPYLKTNPGCTLDPIQDQTIQKYGLELLEGIDLSNTDFGAAKIKFANAVSELSKFNQSLYCVNLDGYRFWDLSIAKFWDETFNNPIDEMDSCQSLQATWNPAILIVDGLQHTGESEIIQVFQTYKSEIIACLNDFPINTYGAAWLDDFGTGDLVRVTGNIAQNNIVSALSEPALLGIGHCPMLMHSMKMQSDLPCLAGLDFTQICEGDGIIDTLVDRGIWSLKVHNDTPDEIMKKGPRANRILFYLDDSSEGSLIVDFWFPRFFFGTSIDDLLNKLNACQVPSGFSETFVPPPSLRNANACIMSLIGNEISPTESIVQCFLQYDNQNPPPFPAFEIKLPVPEICGASNPVYGVPISILAAAIWDGFKSNIQFIEEKTNEAKEKVKEAKEILVKEKMEIENKVEGGENPVVVEPLPEEPDEEEEEIPQIQYEPNKGYPVDGTSPCVSASQQKAAQLFSCIHGESVINGNFGIGPISIPPPSDTDMLPKECNDVVDIDWKSSHGPGVTDPEGPEYWMRGGPIILDVTELSGYGYTDPVPTHLVWWMLANSEKYNIAPNDPNYDLKTSLEDIISKDLEFNPILMEEFNSYLDDRRISELLLLQDSGIGATIELTGKLESINDDSLVINGTSLDISEEVFDSSRFSVGDYVRVVITSSEGELKVERVVLDEGR